MKHWSFLFSYLVAPKGAVCLFVFLQKPWNSSSSSLSCHWRANGSDFLSRRAHSFCFPQPIRWPFSRAQATGTSCHDLHIWFSAETLCCQSSFSSLGLTFRRCQTSGWQQNCWSCQTPITFLIVRHLVSKLKRLIVNHFAVLSQHLK